MVLGRGGELCYMNQLLMVAVLGWLFQVSYLKSGSKIALKLCKKYLNVDIAKQLSNKRHKLK